MTDEVLQGYAADAPDLVGPHEALESEEVLAAVLDLLPRSPVRILDVGAGTGRDGAWLAQQGHAVTAVEPAGPLRETGRSLHPELRWIDDRLPHLSGATALRERFRLILLVGVWQHLPPDAHAEAFRSLARLLEPGGRLVLSLRHGPGAPSRPCFPASPEAVSALAGTEGLRLVSRREAASLQQANRDRRVTWTWLAFDAPA